jgi:prepilin-type N-terminal cleavage/methylation domain-containing protein
MDRRGFTLIEMIVAIVILSVGILGLAASTSYMVSAASSAGLRAEALQAVEGQISQIVMDPRYHQLESIYAGEEADLPGLNGITRVTEISHSKTLLDGRYTDYKVVTVTVDGPGIFEPVSRTVIVGAP